MITTKKTREEMRRWQNFRGQKKDAKCLEAEKNNKKKQANSYCRIPEIRCTSYLLETVNTGKRPTYSMPLHSQLGSCPPPSRRRLGVYSLQMWNQTDNYRQLKVGLKNGTENRGII